MKKIILLLMFVMIALTGVVSAENFVFKQDTTLDLKIACFDEDNNFCNNTVECNITILTPNHDVVVNNQPMTNNSAYYNYTLNTSQMSIAGEHSVITICSGNSTGFSTFTFDVNTVGKELTQSKSMLYIGLLAILIFMFIIDIFAVTQLPAGNTKAIDGEILSINNLKYLRPVLYVVAYALLMAIFFISSNIALAYLQTELIGNIFLMIFKVMGYLLLPMIFVWLAYIIVSIFRDNEIKKMIERGVPVGSSI